MTNFLCRLAPLFALPLVLALDSPASAQLDWGPYGFKKELLARDGGNMNHAGMALSRAGDLAVVAAPRKALTGVANGQAHVYSRHLGGPNNWGELYKLPSPTTADGDQYGSAVAISGSLLLVGAPWYEPSTLTPDTGIVRFHDAATGASAGSFAGPDTGQFFNVGRALDTDGTTVVVGSDRRLFVPTVQPFIGAAFLTDNAGTLSHTLAASDGGACHNFGMSLAIGGGYCAVGAPEAPGAAPTAGALYVFDVATGAQLHKLTAPGGTNSSKFGASVSNDAGKLLVGVSNHFLGSGLLGQAYVFDLTTGALDTQFGPPAGTGGSSFGSRVVLEDGYAYSADLYSSSTYSGRVWQFDLGYGGATCEHQDSRSPKVAAFAEHLAVDGTTIFTGSTGEPYSLGFFGKRGAAFVMERQELGLGKFQGKLFASLDNAVLAIHGGLAGGPAAFVLTAVNGAPAFFPHLHGAFNASGKWQNTLPQMPSLAGLTLEITGGGIDQLGGLSFTNRRVLQFF